MIAITARISAYLFHPLFLILINLFFLLCLNPQWFGVNHWKDKGSLLLVVGIYTIFIPIISFVMLKFLNVIKSLEMQDRTERIFPLIICMIFYLWLWINLKQDPSIPKAWNMFMLTSIISTAFSLALNTWIKISIHVVGIVACLCFWLFIRMYFCTESICYFRFDSLGLKTFNLDYALMILFVLVGWIMSSRLILKAHEFNEIIIGTLVGIFSVIISNKITY